jgi:hypothetical protein
MAWSCQFRQGYRELRPAPKLPQGRNRWRTCRARVSRSRVALGDKHKFS